MLIAYLCGSVDWVDAGVVVGAAGVTGCATGLGLVDVGANGCDFGGSGTVVIALSGLSR